MRDEFSQGPISSVEKAKHYSPESRHREENYKPRQKVGDGKSTRHTQQKTLPIEAGNRRGAVLGNV